MQHLSMSEIEAAMLDVLASPASVGTVELIAIRPELGEREVVESVEVDLAEAVVGDNWRARGSRRHPEGLANPEAQVTIMNVRFARLVAGDRDRVALAGDQFYVDLDLSHETLPAGTRLTIGTAIVEISEQPHTGCVKFTERFGMDATRYANSERGRALRLRGLNAKVVRAGTVSLGDAVRVV